MLLVDKTPKFKEDLRAIANYIAEHNVDASMRFLSSVDETARRLSIHPISGTACQFRQPIVEGLRMITVKRFRSYLICFRPLVDRVELVRLVHGARQQPTIFESQGE
jgi:toxin ParE1/3/4